MDSAILLTRRSNDSTTGSPSNKFTVRATWMEYIVRDDYCFVRRWPVDIVQAWQERGIVGRGVLLDFHSWRLANNVPYDPFSTGSITLDELRLVLAAQSTDIQFGDILIIRSGEWDSFKGQWSTHWWCQGYIAAYNNLSENEVQKLASVVPPPLSGVEQNVEILEWIWDNFAAVGKYHGNGFLSPSTQIIGDPTKDVYKRQGSYTDILWQKSKCWLSVAGDQPSFECWREWEVSSRA